MADWKTWGDFGELVELVRPSVYTYLFCRGKDVKKGAPLNYGLTSYCDDEKKLAISGVNLVELMLLWCFASILQSEGRQSEESGRPQKGGGSGAKRFAGCENENFLSFHIVLGAGMALSLYNEIRGDIAGGRVCVSNGGGD